MFRQVKVPLGAKLVTGGTLRSTDVAKRVVEAVQRREKVI